MSKLYFTFLAALFGLALSAQGVNASDLADSDLNSAPQRTVSGVTGDVVEEDVSGGSVTSVSSVEEEEVEAPKKVKKPGKLKRFWNWLKKGFSCCTTAAVDVLETAEEHGIDVPDELDGIIDDVKEIGGKVIKAGDIVVDVVDEKSSE